MDGELLSVLSGLADTTKRRPSLLVQILTALAIDIVLMHIIIWLYIIMPDLCIIYNNYLLMSSWFVTFLSFIAAIISTLLLFSNWNWFKKKFLSIFREEIGKISFFDIFSSNQLSKMNNITFEKIFKIFLNLIVFLGLPYYGLLMSLILASDILTLRYLNFSILKILSKSPFSPFALIALATLLALLIDPWKEAEKNISQNKDERSTAQIISLFTDFIKEFAYNNNRESFNTFILSRFLANIIIPFYLNPNDFIKINPLFFQITKDFKQNFSKIIEKCSSKEPDKHNCIIPLTSSCKELPHITNLKDYLTKGCWYEITLGGSTCYALLAQYSHASKLNAEDIRNAKNCIKKCKNISLQLREQLLEKLNKNEYLAGIIVGDIHIIRIKLWVQALSSKTMDP